LITPLLTRGLITRAKDFLKPHKREDKNMILRVSLGFTALPDMEVDNFAQGVIDAMTGNAAYPAPPVTMANLQTAKDDFTAKIAAAQFGCSI
jgi:hypothetical protein